MDYKIAKQLKEVGFPQPKNGELVHGIPWEEEDCYHPTLSELVDACAVAIVITIQPDGYTSIGYECVEYDGKTPEDAVAKLYIKLHGTYGGTKKNS